MSGPGPILQQAHATKAESLEPLDRLRKLRARERLEQLPVEWALEAEVKQKQALIDQINRSVTATLRARAEEHGRLRAEAAAWRAGEPLGAACVLVLAVLAWCARRRHRWKARQPSGSELELAEKRRQAHTDDVADVDVSVLAARRVPGGRRCSRQLSALLNFVASTSPRLAFVLRGWLGTETKRRASDFTGPACVVESSAFASSDESMARSTSRASISALAQGSARTTPSKEPLDLCPALSGSTSDPPSVLSRAQLAQLSCALPARLGIRDCWSLVYSTEQHGCSLWTFYSRAVSADCALVVHLFVSAARLAVRACCLAASSFGFFSSSRGLPARCGCPPAQERCGPSMLIVLDSGGSIFGAFLSQPWHR